jgi:hypothetical protein
MKRAILFVAFAALCGAQTTVNGGRDYKGTLKASGSVSAVDFSGAGARRRQSGHFGVAADGVHTGAGLLRHGRSGGAEPVLLHGHGGAGSLDADERQRGRA